MGKQVKYNQNFQQLVGIILYYIMEFFDIKIFMNST